MSVPSASNGPSSSHSDEPAFCRRGDTVSIWKLGAPLARGTWFELHRAAPQSLVGEPAYDYVLKLVRRDLPRAQLSAALTRLARVAAAADSIAHRGMVPLLDAELDQPPFHVVQPWMSGGTLRSFVEASRDISLLRCLHIFRQIAETLASAHDRGRVYLGIDPDHVLLGSGGRIVLTGWSDSRLENQPIADIHEDPNRSSFPPPELTVAGAAAQPASDVHQLGVFVFWVLAGMTPPRNGSSRAAQTRARNLIRFQPACPAPLSHLVREMLSPAPEDRPAMRQVLESLISVEFENLENPSLIRL